MDQFISSYIIPYMIFCFVMTICVTFLNFRNAEENEMKLFFAWLLFPIAFTIITISCVFPLVNKKRGNFKKALKSHLKIILEADFKDHNKQINNL